MDSARTSSEPRTGRINGPGRMRGVGSIDWAMPIGALAAFGILLVAVTAGQSPHAYLSWPAVALVLGGTLAVTVMSFPMTDLVQAWHLLPSICAGGRLDFRAAARRMLLMSEATRRTGAQTLRDILSDLRSEPFLHRAVGLVADGVPPQEIEEILIGDAESALAGKIRAIAVLRRAADTAPAMGLIGTLVGLVQMLSSLDDPASIGPAMALALLTTLYGAVLGNMLLHPLANKLDAQCHADAGLKQLYLTGAVSIARQDHPRRLELLLNAALPPGHQVRLFESRPYADGRSTQEGI